MKPKKEVKKDGVRVEKGPFDTDPLTIMTMSYPEKVEERAKQLAMIRDGQRLHYETPSQ